MTGLQDFKKVLKEFKSLSVWGAGSSALLPFIASFLSVIPPWPSQLSVITAAVQLITLIVVYQGFSDDSRKISRSIRPFAFVGLVVLLGYIALFSMFTIYVPQAHRAIVVGYECTTSAASIFRDRCPFLTVDDLAGAAYDEFLLWTKSSITVMRVVLVGAWLALFILFASILGQFLIIQMHSSKRPVRRGR